MLNLITLSKLLLIIGGIAWGIYGALKINIIKELIPDQNIQRVIFVFVGFSALILMFNRNFYLPFLGETVLPQSLLNKDNKPSIGTFSIEVKVEPNVRVIYWASETTKDILPVSAAYGEFLNSGITTSDKNGIAKLVLRKPSSYTVKKGLFKKTLKPHIHYRYTLPNGLMSEIKTVYINKKESRLFRSRSSNSSTSSKSPRSDLTKIKKCNCPNRHINIHENYCKEQFNNSIESGTIIETPNVVDKIDNFDKLFNQNQLIENIFENNQEVNRSLETILKDRDLNSEINIDKFPQIYYENTSE
jgi:uncharacterized membrane protein YuzA (DUF378 family)